MKRAAPTPDAPAESAVIARLRIVLENEAVGSVATFLGNRLPIAVLTLLAGLVLSGAVPGALVSGEPLPHAALWQLLLIAVTVSALTAVGLKAGSPSVATAGTALLLIAIAIAGAHDQILVLSFLVGAIGAIAVLTVVAGDDPVVAPLAVARSLVVLLLGGMALVIAAMLATVAFRTGNGDLVGPAAGALVVAALVGAGAFPFHLWIPPFLAGARPVRSALGVGVVQLVGLGAVLSLSLQSPWLFGEGRWSTLLTIGVGSAVISGALALGEREPRRAVAHLVGMQGIVVVVGLISRSIDGVAGAVLVLLTLGPTLLLIAPLGGPGTGQSRVERLALGIGMLGLIGLPPTPGFWGRAAILTAIAVGSSGDLGPSDQTRSTIVGVLLVAQILAIVATARHARAFFADDAAAEAAPESGADRSRRARRGERFDAGGLRRWVLLGLMVGTVAIGLYPAPLLQAIASALVNLPLG